MATYETLFITRPDLTDAEETTVVSGLAEVVGDGGGKMVLRDRLGRRRLAYPIHRCDDGVYTLFLYDSDASVPAELERRIRISDKVLRWLTIRHEPQWAAEIKERAVKDAQARQQAEEARAAAAEKAKAEAARRAAEQAEAAEAAAHAAEEAGAASREAAEDEAAAEPATDKDSPVAADEPSKD